MVFLVVMLEETRSVTYHSETSNIFVKEEVGQIPMRWKQLNPQGASHGVLGSHFGKAPWNGQGGRLRGALCSFDLSLP